MGHIIVNRDKTDDVAKQYPVKIYINEKENFTNVNGKVTVNATIYTNIFLTKDKGHLEAPSLPVLENYQYMKTGTQLQPSYDAYNISGDGIIGKSINQCYIEYRSKESTKEDPTQLLSTEYGIYTYDNDNNPHPYYGYLHRNVDGDNSVKYMSISGQNTIIHGITNELYDGSSISYYTINYDNTLSYIKSASLDFTYTQNQLYSFSDTKFFNRITGINSSNERIGNKNFEITLSDIYPQNKDSYFKNIKIDSYGDISFNGYHGLCDNVVIKGKLPNSEYHANNWFTQTKQNTGFFNGFLSNNRYYVTDNSYNRNYYDMHGKGMFLYSLGFDFYTENSNLHTTQKKIKQFVTDLFSGTELENKYVENSHHYNRLLKLFCTGENGFYTPPQERLFIENFCGKRYNSPDFWLARLAGGYEKERKNIENKNNIFYIVGQDNSEIEYEENVFPAHIKAGDEFATLTSNSTNRGYASNPFSAVFRFSSKGNIDKKLELEKIDIKKVVIPKTKEIKGKSAAPYFRILQNEITTADYNLLLPEETCDIFYNSNLLKLCDKYIYKYYFNSIFNNLNINNTGVPIDISSEAVARYKNHIKFIFSQIGLYDKNNIADFAMSNALKSMNSVYTKAIDVFNNSEYKTNNDEIDLIKMLGNDNISNLLSIKGGKGDYIDDTKSLKLDFNMSVNYTNSPLLKDSLSLFNSQVKISDNIGNVFFDNGANDNNGIITKLYCTKNTVNQRLHEYQYIYVMPVEINVNLTFDTEHIKKHVDEDFTYYSSEEWFIDLYQNIDNDMDNMVDVDEQYSVTWDYKSSVNEFYFLDNNGEQYTNFSSLISSSQSNPDIIESMFTFYALINDITGTYEKLGNDEYKMVFSKDGKISIKLNKKKIYDRAQKLKIPQPKHPFIKADFHSKIKTTIGGEFASNAKCKEIL